MLSERPKKKKRKRKNRKREMNWTKMVTYKQKKNRSSKKPEDKSGSLTFSLLLFGVENAKKKNGLRLLFKKKKMVSEIMTVCNITKEKRKTKQVSMIKKKKEQFRIHSTHETEKERQS